MQQAILSWPQCVKGNTLPLCVNNEVNKQYQVNTHMDLYHRQYMHVDQSDIIYLQVNSSTQFIKCNTGKQQHLHTRDKITFMLQLSNQTEN